MTATQIKEIGRLLKVRRKMRELRDLMIGIRPTLSPDTVYRAFTDTDCNTELLWEIREAGKRLLEQEMAVSEAA